MASTMKVFNAAVAGRITPSQAADELLARPPLAPAKPSWMPRPLFVLMLLAVAVASALFHGRSSKQASS